MGSAKKKKKIGRDSAIVFAFCPLPQKVLEWNSLHNFHVCNYNMYKVYNFSPGSVVLSGQFTVRTDDTNEQVQGVYVLGLCTVL